MSSDCLSYARSCQRCQSSKIFRHVRSPLVGRPLPDERFTSLHLDLVGPLPESEGMVYLLTVIDRYSRWLEAIPLASATAQDCAPGPAAFLGCEVRRPSGHNHGSGPPVYLKLVVGSHEVSRREGPAHDFISPSIQRHGGACAQGIEGAAYVQVFAPVGLDVQSPVSVAGDWFLHERRHGHLPCTPSVWSSPPAPGRVLFSLISSFFCQHIRVCRPATVLVADHDALSGRVPLGPSSVGPLCPVDLPCCLCPG